VATVESDVLQSTSVFAPFVTTTSASAWAVRPATSVAGAVTETLVTDGAGGCGVEQAARRTAARAARARRYNLLTRNGWEVLKVIGSP
jgi:hypothetical protein